MTPPFKPEINQEGIDTRFFNAKNDPKALAETVIPVANLQKVKKNRG